MYSPRFPRFYWRGQSGVLSCMTDVDICTAWDAHAQEQSIVGRVLFASPSLGLPLSPPPFHPRRGRGLRFTFVSRSVKGSCTRNPENWTERSVLPANVPQMNDHLESHKPFFSATEIHGSNDRKILKPIPPDFPFPAEPRKLAFLIPRLFKSFDFAIGGNDIQRV